MKKGYYYTVKYGSKLQQGGCNGTFKIFTIENERIVLKLIHKQNVVTMSHNYSRTLDEVIKREINPNGFLAGDLEKLQIRNNNEYKKNE